MSGYRCVNFTDLCRLCSSAGNNNIQIFSDESLQKKIAECLPITLNERDKLPKVICTQCLDYVQVFSEFRQSCSKAQKMLESCLNTSKLRNGGQVYIKDEIPVKKVLKPIQNPSPTKLIPNLCNIITSTPTKQIKNNILTSPNTPDFLSSIMQAVGIQTNDDAADNNISFSQNIQPQQNQMQSVPQYTLTLDGGTLKSGQIQYKIENAGNLSIPSQTQIIAKNVQDAQNQQPGTMSVDEFLKLSSKKSAMVKKNPVTVAQVEEPKTKKPKFNLILQASPQKQKLAPQVTVTPAQKSFGSPSTLNTPSKPQIQIHNIEKIMPVTSQSSPTKQLVLPIMRNADAAQLISQALTMSNNQAGMDNKSQPNPPFAYVQMKIQPNADGQLTLTPASSVQTQQHLQLSLSPQQLQQLSFQAPPQQQQQVPALAMQPQITVTQVSTQEQTDSQTQTGVKQESADDDDDDNFDNSFEADDYYLEETEDSVAANEPEEKATVKPYIIKKSTKAVKAARKIKTENLTELQSVQQGHSDIAKKQLNQLTSFNTKRAESETAEKPSDLNLTVCDVCRKVFKRKEFLMQHLKSHIGLRPFKCDEPTCNKSFSRKEHLLRHIVSHTGKKMFNCDVCNKLFSRKDNLNKHRRIHPETGPQSVRHKCSTCSKAFAHRAQLAKHQLICDGKSDGNGAKTTVGVKDVKSKPSSVAKKAKHKTDKKPPEAPAKSPAIQPSQPPVLQQQLQPQQQQQILTILQQPQQQLKVKNEPQQQQIILSMSQAQAMLQSQQPKGAIYTFPTNLILNSNGAFMTNSGEVVRNFKFENP